MARKKSPVWKYFRESEGKFKCIYCGNVFGKNNITKKLRHLASCNECPLTLQTKFLKQVKELDLKSTKKISKVNKEINKEIIALSESEGDDDIAVTMDLANPGPKKNEGLLRAFDEMSPESQVSFDNLRSDDQTVITC